jgi:Ca2+/Na+ antiporter
MSRLKKKNDDLKIAKKSTESNIDDETKVNQGWVEEVLTLELNPSDKNLLINTLTKLAVYMELWLKDNNDYEHFIVAKSKFDTGAAMLHALAPDDPMSDYFLQKKNEWKKEKKKRNIELLVLVGVCIAILIGVLLFADKIQPSQDLDFGSIWEKIQFWR